jgi:hypothetical protein
MDRTGMVKLGQSSCAQLVKLGQSSCASAETRTTTVVTLEICRGGTAVTSDLLGRLFADLLELDLVLGDWNGTDPPAAELDARLRRIEAQLSPAVGAGPP